MNPLKVQKLTLQHLINRLNADWLEEELDNLPFGHPLLQELDDQGLVALAVARETVERVVQNIRLELLGLE